jgi:hypothetical protein
MDGRQTELRGRLRAQAKQLGNPERLATPGSCEIKHLTEKIAYDQWHRLLFARYLVENNLLISTEHGVSVSLDDCEELAPSMGLKDAWLWRLASPRRNCRRYSERMIPLALSHYRLKTASR